MTTPNDFLTKIKQIQFIHALDIEVMHSEIDEAMENLLVELGYDEAVEYIRSVERWYA